VHKVIYTVGYGNTTKEAFQERLKEAVSGGVVMVDVRKWHSGSRNGLWARQGFWSDDRDSMGRTMYELEYGYRAFHTLSNKHGNSKKGFAIYSQELQRGGCLWQELAKLAHIINSECAAGFDPFCLLCVERKPFRKRRAYGITYEDPNCHRVILAAELTAFLHFRCNNSGWRIQHLW